MTLSVDIHTIPRLFGDAVEQLGKLVSSEIKLAKAELSQKITQAGIGAALPHCTYGWTCNGSFQPKVPGHAMDGSSATRRGGACKPAPGAHCFYPFHSPKRATDMPGMWQRYYSRWKVATRGHLDPDLLELVPALAKLCPPAVVVDKTRYTALPPRR
jgi:hypothetical protein